MAKCLWTSVQTKFHPEGISNIFWSFLFFFFNCSSAKKLTLPYSTTWYIVSCSISEHCKTKVVVWRHNSPWRHPLGTLSLPGKSCWCFPPPSNKACSFTGCSRITLNLCWCVKGRSNWVFDYLCIQRYLFSEMKLLNLLLLPFPPLW